MSREFDELLSAYLDGEVSPEERAAVERRLEQSPQLRETLDELSEVGDLIRRLPKPRAPKDLPERVVAAIATKPLASTAAPPKRIRLFGTWPILAAGTVLAACVMIVVLMPREHPNAADGLAMDSARFSEGAGLAAEAVRDLDADHDGSRTASLALENRGAGWYFDTNAEATESLTDVVRRLGRKPVQGEVLKALKDNAGRTQVRQYTVVDTREMANTMRTILINNNLDLIETETPVPQAGVAVAPEATDRLVIFVEGPEEKVGQAVDELEALPAVREVRDLGLVAESSPETTTTEAFVGVEVKPNEDFSITLQKDKAADKPTAAPATEYRLPARAAAPKPDAPAKSDLSLPPLAPAAPVASTAAGAAELKAAKTVELGDQLKEAESVSKVVRPATAQAGGAPGATTKLSTAPASQPTDNYVGVAAQVDSNGAIVQDVLRRDAANSLLGNTAQGNAAQGNSVRRNAVQGNSINGNSSQRESVGQSQNNFYRSKNPVPEEQTLGRKLAESATAGEQRQENQAEAKSQLKQQMGTAGRGVANTARDPQPQPATVANPQNASPQVHFLFIFEPQGARPVAAPVTPAPTPKQDAK